MTRALRPPESPWAPGRPARIPEFPELLPPGRAGVLARIRRRPSRSRRRPGYPGIRSGRVPE